MIWNPSPWMEEEAHGFFALNRAVAASGHPCRALKGQLAGPVTFAGMVKDQEGKAILFDRELTQAVCLGLARKAAWQIKQFRDLGKEPIIFLDEPYLTGFGSAYLPISREEVLEILGQTIEEVRQAAGGPVAIGLHCCGNTDWGLLLSAPIDLLSFDSYGYFESLRLYDKAVSEIFRAGRLAGLGPGAHRGGRVSPGNRRRPVAAVHRPGGPTGPRPEDRQQRYLVPGDSHPGLRHGISEPGGGPAGLEGPGGPERPGAGVAGVAVRRFLGHSVKLADMW